MTLNNTLSGRCNACIKNDSKWLIIGETDLNTKKKQMKRVASIMHNLKKNISIKMWALDMLEIIS